MSAIVYEMTEMSKLVPPYLRDVDAEQFVWSVDDVARYLGVSTRTVDRWIDGDALPVHRVGVGRKTKRFVPGEVREWVRSRCFDSADAS